MNEEWREKHLILRGIFGIICQSDWVYRRLGLLIDGQTKTGGRLRVLGGLLNRAEFVLFIRDNF